MTVATLTASDAEALAAIDALCFSVPWSRTSFSDALKNDAYSFVGVFDGERLVGYAGMTAVLDEGDVTNVAVHPDHRRRGLGRTLVTALVAEAERRGLSLLHLEVREGNLAARSLYETLGFACDGKRKSYYRHPTEDAILMTLTL